MWNQLTNLTELSVLKSKLTVSFDKYRKYTVIHKYMCMHI